MAQSKSQEGRILEELLQIKSLLQNILIIQGAQAGMKKEEVRKMVGLASKRVSSVWQNLNIKQQD